MTDLAEEVQALPHARPEERSLLDHLLMEDPGFLDRLTPDQAQAIRYDWSMVGRPSQQIPHRMGSYFRTWLVKAGRGYGKTRTGSETTKRQAEVCERLALVAPTSGDVRDTMIEGESGLYSVYPPHQRPVYRPSLRRVDFPATGAFAITYTAEEPERLRGPQHEWAWIDEPASMRYGDRLISNLLLGLRLGRDPWLLITGTPKPVAWLRELSREKRTFVTSGSTYDNVDNLSAMFIRDVMDRYEGTRLGRQELHAEWLDDVEGALWTEDIIHRNRWREFTPPSDWRVVVGVDPPGETAECGIIVGAAPARPQRNSDAVILGDFSLAGPPEVWGRTVVDVWRRFGADEAVVESNQGGDMVRSVIHAIDPQVPVAKARTSEGKAARAEPVSALYARNRVHHVGYFGGVESQMETWVPSEAKSPDRLDALVWCVAALLPIDALVEGSVISMADRLLPDFRRLPR